MNEHKIPMQSLEHRRQSLEAEIKRLEEKKEKLFSTFSTFDFSEKVCEDALKLFSASFMLQEYCLGSYGDDMQKIMLSNSKSIAYAYLIRKNDETLEN